jgi:predicted secreted protein
VRNAALALFLLGWGSVNPAPALAQDAEPHATVLHLSQTAERTVTRDMLRVELRIEETGADAPTVQAALNRRMAAALDRARQAQHVHLETGSYYVGEERPPNRPPSWRGAQSLILKSGDSDTTLKLAGELQSAGLSVVSLGYEVSPKTVRSALDELTTEALAALDRRAASIAGAMHLSVLRYRDLRVGNAETEGRPVPRFGGAAMAAAAPPVAEPGEAMVRVTVEAELLLGKPRP